MSIPASAKGSEEEKVRSGSAVICTEQQPSGHRWVKAKILIHAPPEVVWETVHEERSKDPDLAYSKVLHQENNELTLEQKFVLLPVIGTATCVMSNAEEPLHRIDYRLLESDHFRAMEGSWVLTPQESGKDTLLELSSYLELGFPVPRPILDTLTARKLERRITNVKLMAERTQSRIAHKLSS